MRILKTAMIASALLGFGVAAGGTAQAAGNEQPMIIAEPEKVREMARGYGSARVTKDTLGDPMVAGKTDGLGYSIFFYSCEKGEKCTSIQFHSSFDLGKKVSLSVINDWNVKKRFTKAERNNKGQPVLRLDYPFSGGVSREHLDNVMDLWAMLLKEFAGHIGYRK